MLFYVLLKHGICFMWNMLTPNNQFTTVVKMVPLRIHVSDTFNIQWITGKPS